MKDIVSQANRLDLHHSKLNTLKDRIADLPLPQAAIGAGQTPVGGGRHLNVSDVGFGRVLDMATKAAEHDGSDAGDSSRHFSAFVQFHSVGYFRELNVAVFCCSCKACVRCHVPRQSWRAQERNVLDEGWPDGCAGGQWRIAVAS